MRSVHYLYMDVAQKSVAALINTTKIAVTVKIVVISVRLCVVPQKATSSGLAMMTGVNKFLYKVITNQVTAR